MHKPQILAMYHSYPRVLQRTSSKLPRNVRFSLVGTLKRRSFSGTAAVDPYTQYYTDEKYKGISELQQFNKLLQQIDSQQCLTRKNNNFSDTIDFSHSSNILNQIGLSPSNYLLLFDSALITHCLHIQSRIAAFEGQGFYTIGPCGEECIAPIGLLLSETDAMALHYRHLSGTIARQLTRDLKISGGSETGSEYDGNNMSTWDNIRRIIRDRARGYCVSINDPIGGASHCLLGSNNFDYDYLVTSTLASQLPPALGRALGGALYNRLGLPDGKFPFVDDDDDGGDQNQFVSFVSVGDGSVNNAHFLTAINNALYAIHNGNECPLLIGISNNKLSISLKDESNWLESFVSRHMTHFPKYKCDGTNMLNVYYSFNQALNYVKKNKKPAMIVFDEIPRQFGHAATDRQNAYLTNDEIQSAADQSVLSMLCNQCANDLEILSYDEIKQRLLTIATIVKEEFESVKQEPKLTNTLENRQVVKNRNSPAIVNYTAPNEETVSKYSANIDILSRKRNLMRKIMNASIEEAFLRYDNLIYIGEDVRHGGYYLITEGLASKYSSRVLDYPPDETTIFGCGMGFSQSGLLPIVEMPYAKYLDCAADMFFESLVMNWLSNGQQPNGMLIRLQGFANGLFGGNFHTHNSLYLPPGLDVVCYSNGTDYARGMRYNMEQVKNGRIVMSVDCTALLNARHVYSDLKESSLMLPMPRNEEYMAFDDCVVYPPPEFDNNKLKSFKKIILSSMASLNGLKSSESQVVYSNASDYRYDITDDSNNNNTGVVLIVSYGLGVNIAREAQKELQLEYGYSNVIVVDTPYLSDVPKEFTQFLKQIVNEYGNNAKIVFADICKEGQNPFNGYISKLQNSGLLSKFGHWLSVAAQYTYNPLGQDLTFLNKQDVVDTVRKL